MNRAGILAVAALAASGAALAQAPLHLPDVSPKAGVSQTIGVTEIAIVYHRPGVNGRVIWGKLVPYGDVWRTGANENTTISFSTPVTVGGTKLAAGTYGFHAIPGEKEWTLILSREHEAWGSFAYDPKEDALRVGAVPEAAPFTERLEYTFDDPTPDGVKATLRWEKLKVSLPITVDSKTEVVESLRHQLTGLARFSWQGWNQAAAWCASEGTNLDEAMRWVDRSLSMDRNFQNLRTKAALVEKEGDAAGAEALRKEALAVATEADLNGYGYGLLAQGKLDEAITVFERNVKGHPASWNAHDSLAEAWARKGNRAKAISLYEKARSMTTNEDQRKRIDGELAKLKG